MGAVAIKKASSVASSASSGSAASTAASIVPAVLNLVSGVKSLNSMQKELENDCIPTAQEISFVDSTLKEWAKTGEMSAKEVERKLGRKPCPGGIGYESAVRIAAGTQDVEVCYDNYAGTDADMIWYGYPKVGNATYCADGLLNCGEKSKKHASDIYDIFNLISFSADDYTKTEATMAARLMDKIERCSYSKLSAKKREMWGEFLTNTMSNVGQKTDTGMIMQSVGGITTNGLGGGLQSLGAIATQFMDR